MGVSEYVEGVASLFKNVTLNSLGIKRDLYQLLADKDVKTAINMMQDNDVDVDNALSEYYPQKHKVMSRPNKVRKNLPPYITCKLPRALQRNINEVELFFLFGSPVVWKKVSGDDEAYELFINFIKSSRFDSNIRRVKRIAGSETECAKLYHIYRNDSNEVTIKPVILARSTGYQLRPMFDQFGEMVAFAYGYRVKESGRSVQHWDIHTPELIFECEKGNVGWSVSPRPNPTGKINVLYYKQPKAWDGAEARIDRIEDTDSKIGDTNNYYAEPIAFATADVVELMKDPDATGKMIKATGAQSKFEYINPPSSSELRAAEKQDLHDTVFFDTFTPDFSFEKIKGLGTLSGKAIKNAMTLGFLKRANRMEIYGEMLDREKNVIISALKVQHPEMSSKLDELVVSFQFGEPFGDDAQDNWSAIANLYKSGVASIETVVDMLSLTDKPDEEIDRIRMAAVESTLANAEAKEEKTQETQIEGEQE